jgi:hypothetical protein
MSDSDSPAPAPGTVSTPSPPPRHGCLTAFMVLVGIVLLLPGLCAVVFSATAVFSRYESGFTPFIVAGLLVGFGGIMLIREAIRGPRP